MKREQVPPPASLSPGSTPTLTAAPVGAGEPLSPVRVRSMPHVRAVVPWGDPELARALGPFSSPSPPLTPMHPIGRAARSRAAVKAPGPMLLAQIAVMPVIEAVPVQVTVTPPVLNHLCDVLTLIERRPVGPDEILNLLERLLRQHRLGKGGKCWQDAPPRGTGPP